MFDRGNTCAEMLFILFFMGMITNNIWILKSYKKISKFIRKCMCNTRICRVKENDLMRSQCSVWSGKQIYWNTMQTFSAEVWSRSMFGQILRSTKRLTTCFSEKIQYWMGNTASLHYGLAATCCVNEESLS